MTTSYIQLAIEKAIEGGYDHDKQFLLDVMETRNDTMFLLDPSFWQALGKSLGWGRQPYRTETGGEFGKRICLHCEVDCTIQPPKESGCNHVHYPEACEVCRRNTLTWKEQMHRFIDHLIQGHDPESFFKILLS